MGVMVDVKALLRELWRKGAREAFTRRFPGLEVLGLEGPRGRPPLAYALIKTPLEVVRFYWEAPYHEQSLVGFTTVAGAKCVVLALGIGKTRIGIIRALAKRLLPGLPGPFRSLAEAEETIREAIDQRAGLGWHPDYPWRCHILPVPEESLVESVELAHPGGN